MRRFYESVGIAEADGGFAVELDGRPVLTPGRRPLTLPAKRLAQAIMAEWESQDEKIQPATMPLTRLANSALDRASEHREKIITEIVAYAETDLVCYRTDEPPELVERQTLTWQPLVDWLAARHGATLELVSGILPAAQPPASVAAMRDAVEGFDDFRLMALHTAVAISGSAVIGLALADGRLDATTAWEAASLDETYQNERWGEDPLGTERREGARREIRAVGDFLAALG